MIANSNDFYKVDPFKSYVILFNHSLFFLISFQIWSLIMISNPMFQMLKFGKKLHSC